MINFRRNIYASVWLIACACTKAPQIIKFEANTQSIHKGQKVKLNWEVQDIKPYHSVFIKPFSHTQEAKGELTINPDKSQKYELMVLDIRPRRQNREINRELEINVEDTFLKGNEIIYAGEEANLEWQVSPKAEKVWLKEVINDKIYQSLEQLVSKGTCKVKPLQTTQYVLYVMQDGEIFDLSHIIKVLPCYFTGTKTILHGEEAQLMWKVNPDVKSVSLETKENSYTLAKMQENLSHKGFVKVKPEKTTDYVLHLTGSSQTKFIHTVEVAEAIFTGSKEINVGEAAILDWKANPKARRVWIEEAGTDGNYIRKDNLASEGMLEVFPSASTSYFLAVHTDEVKRYELPVNVKFKSQNLTMKDTARVYQSVSPVLSENELKIINNPKSFKKSSLENTNDEPMSNEPLVIVNKQIVAHFDFNKSEIQEPYFDLLDKLAAFLKSRENSVLEIYGYSDLKGTSAGCLKISEERAKIIKDYLLQKGVEEYRMMTKAMSRTQPLWFKEDNQQQAAENRRVEISIFE